MRANEFLNETKRVTYQGIDLMISMDGASVDVRAMNGDRQMAYVVFDRDGKTLVADDLAVDERFKGQGIASVMYDYVKSLGFTIKRSFDQTEQGKYFWDKNRGEEATVWEEITSSKCNEDSGTVKVVDILEESTNELRQLLEQDCLLFESMSGWDEIRSVLNNIPTTEPTVGKKYSVLSLTFMPPGRALVIKGHSDPLTLIDLSDNGRYRKLVFKRPDGTKLQYPGDSDSGDISYRSYLFTDSKDINKYLTYINLKLDDWLINNYISTNNLDESVLAESWPFRNKSKVYNLLIDRANSGPFDGGCVVFAQALQLKYGGDIVVLVGTPNRNVKQSMALHAMLYLNGKLIDADGPADPKTAIERFIKNELEYVGGTVDSIRPIAAEDLPEAPRDAELAQEIAKLL